MERHSMHIRRLGASEARVCGAECGVAANTAKVAGMNQLRQTPGKQRRASSQTLFPKHKQNTKKRLAELFRGATRAVADEAPGNATAAAD